jgi:DNA polymerase-1
VLEEIAIELRDPTLNLIIEAKHLHNLRNTFLEGIKRRTDHLGRVHTQFSQNKAVTGRLSSSDPNMQNVVSAENDAYSIREIISALSPDTALGIADYAALEMMLLGEAAQDMKLISVFDSGKDVHMGNASLVYGVAYDEMKKAKEIDEKVKGKDLPASAMTARIKELMFYRKAVKVIAYGLNYGMKSNKLAYNLDISKGEAEKLMARYMATYPAVGHFFKETQDFLETHGYVTSALGRIRSLPEIGSPNQWERFRAGRQAANFIIQGSAAECAKMAMLRMYEEKMPERTGWFILSQIHDEIITEGPKETATEAMQILQQCMERPFWAPLRVPLKASPKVARSWHEAK